MKVRVVLRVDVDLDAYRAEYGDPNASADEVREAVKLGVAAAVETDGIVFPGGERPIIRRVDLDGYGTDYND